MMNIIITTQKEYDALPEKFGEYTRININCGNIWLQVRKIPQNSSVVAWGNSSVKAWGNSLVEARENSSVEAWDNSVIRIFSKLTKVILNGFSVVFLPIDIKLNIAVKKQSEYAYIQKIKPLNWFENNGIKKTSNIILYKRVSKDFLTQENTPNQTEWKINSIVEHPNWNPKEDECGMGKFHAVSRPYFADEFRNKKDDKYIAIEIAKKDLYEWPNPNYPHKIGFREGKVLYQCDMFGKKSDDASNN